MCVCHVWSTKYRETSTSEFITWFNSSIFVRYQFSGFDFMLHNCKTRLSVRKLFHLTCISATLNGFERSRVESTEKKLWVLWKYTHFALLIWIKRDESHKHIRVFIEIPFQVKLKTFFANQIISSWTPQWRNVICVKEKLCLCERRMDFEIFQYCHLHCISCCYVNILNCWFP